MTTVAETGLSLAVVEFVRQGLGVGWLPTSIVAQDIANGDLVDLREQLPNFTLSVVLLRLEGPMSASGEEFWQNAKECIVKSDGAEDI
ncbi:LysR substrate-binding domain-containing protein [Ruegeria sp. 2205SS24-7]|nr:LysR substrate-binding domain-containing protein [Ruegeria sp. 2205SS24-7]MDP5220899.1 LysR substrate-binding domain-containing protein [Ruegeria sp. 2205SS24-7]